MAVKSGGTFDTAGLDAVTRFIQQGFPKPSAYEDVLDGESQQQDVAAPNADTFCAIFRGLMDPACTASVESVTEYAQVSNLMQEMDVAPGPRIVALGLRRYLQDGELDLVCPSPDSCVSCQHTAMFWCCVDLGYLTP